MVFYTYILVSEADNRFYYGQTQHLSTRLASHNNGYSAYTKKYRPWKLLAFKKFETRSEAMKMEKRLKNLKSSSKLLIFIQKNNFQEVIGPEK